MDNYKNYRDLGYYDGSQVSDEFVGRYCEFCHISTGLCDCKDCDECNS